MKYMLLIYTSEAEDMRRASDAVSGAAIMAEYQSFTNALTASGRLSAGEALQPTTNAKTVRIRDGKADINDGPFAETKEQLGGFYLVDADNLDEAIAWASRIPGAKWGCVEVRPVIDFSNMPG
ncbi:MAG: YciI family protein [Dehalococcoidia bacterium]|nr:MAG: YciI family protein [Dehalococcoidia bacterium]